MAGLSKACRRQSEELAFDFFPTSSPQGSASSLFVIKSRQLGGGGRVGGSGGGRAGGGAEAVQLRLFHKRRKTWRKGYECIWSFKKIKKHSVGSFSS